MPRADSALRSEGRRVREGRAIPSEKRTKELAEWREHWSWAFATLDHMRSHITTVEAALQTGTLLGDTASTRARLQEVRDQHVWLAERLHKLTGRKDSGLLAIRKLRTDHAERDMGRQSIAEAVEEVRLYFATRPRARGQQAAWKRVRARLDGKWAEERILELPLEWATESVINMMLIRGLVTPVDASDAEHSRKLKIEIHEALVATGRPKSMAGAEYVGSSTLYRAFRVVAGFGGFGAGGEHAVRRIHQAFATGPLGGWIARVSRTRKPALSGT